MTKKPIHLDGQTWDIQALRTLASRRSLPGSVERQRLSEQMGPSALLGLASRSTTASPNDARTLLRSDFGFDRGTASRAVAIGGLVSTDSVRNDPVGFLADVNLSAAARERISRSLGSDEAPSPPAGDRLNIAAAKRAWDHRALRRFALDAARTSDPTVMTTAAAVVAGLRHRDSKLFMARLTESQTYPLASGGGTRLARRANAVLAGAYALASMDPAGMNLGFLHWKDATPSWRAQAAIWVLPILDSTNGGAIADLLNAIDSRGLRFCEPGTNPFPFADSAIELDDARLRIHTCADQLTKWIDRPMWFDGGAGNVQVLVTQDEERYLYAWVGVNGVGMLVAFDLIDFLPYGPDVPGVRAALALALSWYLDVSISLRRSPSGTAAVSRASGGTSKAGARYVPTPSFHQQVTSVATGTNSPPRLHGVVAHLRTFTNGSKPSRAARQRAPARLRATMKANQTFVQGYLKGHGNVALVKNRLSRHSALADAIAGLDRRSC